MRLLIGSGPLTLLASFLLRGIDFVHLLMQMSVCATTALRPNANDTLLQFDGCKILQRNDKVFVSTVKFGAYSLVAWQGDEWVKKWNWRGWSSLALSVYSYY